jgi:cell division protein FtsZ
MIRFEDDKPTETPVNISFAEGNETGASIKVVGVGGGGGNAVNRMIASRIGGVDFLSANTDLQALRSNYAPVKIQLGSKLTKGLGCGADPEVGRQAALEDTEKILEALEGADMVFITAGLGGGTGTGGAPILASLASELGALTVAVVTKPFTFEGKTRMAQAVDGIRELRDCVDTLISIPNDRLLSTVDRNTSLAEAFSVADDVLRQAVQVISDLITVPGLINLDFADVRTIMRGMGDAVMGTGVAKGENRAVEAAQKAISSPLLEEASIEGARGVIINITGGEDMSLMEVNEASSVIHQAADENANIIFGAVVDPSMDGRLKITVIATGFQRADKAQRRRAATTPVDIANYAKGREATAGSSGFYRRGVSENLSADLDFGTLDGEEGEDLDVPTFLRKSR